MKRFLLGFALLASSVLSAYGGELRNVDNMPILVLSLTDDLMPRARDHDLIQLAQANPSIMTDPPMPVQIFSPTKETVAFGDYAGAILQWMLPIFLPIIAGLAVDLYVKLRTKLGLSTTDSQRDKFQEIVENGVALGAHDVQANLSGKLTYDVKNQVMASAVTYAKVLGVDPTSPEAEEAIRARVAKMLANLDASATAVAAGVQAVPPSPLAPPKAAS
jgi:hypothetical protein